MEYNIKEIKEKAKKDFEGTWLETANLIDLKGRKMLWEEKTRGKEHPVISLNLKFREVFLKLGLDEIINPSIIEEGEVYRQYGPEAPVILDRIFYLAGLPRPDIGVSKRKIEEIKKIIPGFKKEKTLEEVFRAFKKGIIESDDLIEELVKYLDIKEEKATLIIDKVFPEFKELKPTSTKLTLRSHMTAAWFSYLANVQDKIPVKLFSIGSRFRREQRLDPHHLYESTSASIVIMNDELTLDDGVEFTKKVLFELGFGKPEFIKKKVTSKYYTPGTEYEVYSQIGEQKIEVANIGFYSPVALANYDIKYPVFNLGFGVERLAMLAEGASDIRALVYGEVFAKTELSDEDIVKELRVENLPASPNLKKLAQSLIKIATEHKDDIGPIEILAYEDKNVNVWIYNWDEAKPMLSFASFNEIYVYQGNIIGLPNELGKGKLSELAIPAKENGINTKLVYLNSIINGFVSRLEKAIKDGKNTIDERYKMAKRPADINLFIPDFVNRYITDNNKKIEVGGPLFFGLKAEIKEE
ncbi:MAG: O-phosphoserine--tRNA ligase [bacterium]